MWKANKVCPSELVMFALSPLYARPRVIGFGLLDDGSRGGTTVAHERDRELMLIPDDDGSFPFEVWKRHATRRTATDAARVDE